MQVVFTKLGVVLAMIFVSFPFVVRTMQPVLQVRGEEGRGVGWGGPSGWAQVRRSGAPGWVFRAGGASWVEPGFGGDVVACGSHQVWAGAVKIRDRGGGEIWVRGPLHTPCTPLAQPRTRAAP